MGRHAERCHGTGALARDFCCKGPGNSPGREKGQDGHNKADPWKTQKEKHLQKQQSWLATAGVYWWPIRG